MDAKNRMICAETCANHYYQEDTSVVSGSTYFKCAAACAKPSTDYRVSKDNETYCYATKCPSEYTFVSDNDKH